MTIRVTCDACGSKLNIKDELAGTTGKCPKCKSEFSIPAVAPDVGPESASPESPAESSSQAVPAADKSAPRANGDAKTKAKMPVRSAAGGGSKDDDFDPVAFLMDDEPASPKAASSPPLSDDEIPDALELDISEDDAPRRRKRNRRRVNLNVDEDAPIGSASASAGAMLTEGASGGASAGAARDLLTRTVEEGRARASRLDEEERPGPSAIKELAREVIVRGLPGLLAITVLVLGVGWFASSMLESGVELPPMGEVSGTITLDGQPLPGARVRFSPVESEQKISSGDTIRVRSSNGITDENGYYELLYDEEITGAAAGDHRVSISKRDGARELVPSQFGPYSRELRTVAEGSQKIDFSLTSDAPPQ